MKHLVWSVTHMYVLTTIYQLNKVVQINLVPRVLFYSCSVARGRERPRSGLVTCLLIFNKWQTNDRREGWNCKVFVSTVPGWESKSVAIQGKQGKRTCIHQVKNTVMVWGEMLSGKLPQTQKRFMNHRVQVVAVCVNRLETLRLGRMCLDKKIVLCSQRRR